MGIARTARQTLYGRIADPARPLTGGPRFDLPHNTSAAEMLRALEEEQVRLQGLDQDQKRGRVFVRDDAAVVRVDIALAREAVELQIAADTMKAELDRANAACAPLRQLVAACHKFTGTAGSTLANMARGA